MTQRFRSPGPLGRSPNNIGGRIPGPLKFGWTDAVDLLSWANPIEVPGKILQKVTSVDVSGWALAEKMVRASATEITIPAGHTQQLERYANANPDDGKVLKHALDAKPSFYKGGWLLSVQSGAKAIVFGNSAFFKDNPPDVATYVHEMVHISQYKKLGRAVFLQSYFGISVATVLYRVVWRQPINIFNSSPHEHEGYEMEQRFEAWIKLNP